MSSKLRDRQLIPHLTPSLSSKASRIQQLLHSWFSIPAKPARTILFVLLFALLPLTIPRLQERLSLKGQSYRELLPHLRELISFRQHSVSATTLATADEAVVEPAGPPKPTNQACADQLIEDPERTMDAFNAALAHTDAKGKGA